MIRKKSMALPGKFWMTISACSLIVWIFILSSTVHAWWSVGDDITSFAISPDNQSIVVGLLNPGQDNTTIIVSDLKTGNLIQELKEKCWIKSIAISSDYIVSASEPDYKIHVWKSGQLQKSWKGHSGRIISVAISSDNEHIFSASSDGTIKIWKRINGDLVKQLKHNQITSLAISDDGKYIVSGAEDGAKLYFSDSWESKEVYDQKVYDKSVTSVAISDKYIVYASAADKTIGVYDLKSGERKEIQLYDYAKSVAISRNNLYIAFVTDYGHVGDIGVYSSINGDGVCNLIDGESEISWIERRVERVISVAITNDNKNVVYGLENGTIEVRTPEDSNLTNNPPEIKKLERQGHEILEGEIIPPINEGEPFIISLRVTDPDEDELFITFDSDPPLGDSAYIDDEKRFRFTPKHNQAGTHKVTFIVDDKKRCGRVQRQVTIFVNGLPTLKLIGSEGQEIGKGKLLSLNEGDSLNITTTADDINGDKVTLTGTINEVPISASKIPGVIFNLGPGELKPTGEFVLTGKFTFEPNHTQAGKYKLAFLADDGKTNVQTQITIEVKDVPPPHPPDLTLRYVWPPPNEKGEYQIDEGQTLTIEVDAGDLDGDLVKLNASGIPENNADFNPPEQPELKPTGTFTFAPDYTQVDKKEGRKYYTPTFFADDGQLKSELKITIIVNDVNVPPVLKLSPPPYQIDEGQTLIITVTAEDPDGDKVTPTTTIKKENDGDEVPLYEMPPGKFPGVTFVLGQGKIDSEGSVITGELTFKRFQKDSGEYEITFTADDGRKNGRVEKKIKINVVPGSISSTESTVVATTPVVANGKKQSEVTITLLDKYKNPISGKHIEIKVTGEENDVTQPKAPTKEEGKTTAYVASTEAEKKKIITAKVLEDNLWLKNSAEVEFIPDAPAIVIVNVEPNKLHADGNSKATVTVNVKDANKNPISGQKLVPVSDQKLVLSMLGQPEDNGDGSYTVIYTAGTKAGQDFITVEAENGKKGQASITLQPWIPSQSKSNVEVAEPVITCGVKSEVTITLLDGDSNPIEGRTVSLDVLDSDVEAIQPTEKTTEKGQTHGWLKSKKASKESKSVVVKVKIDDVTLEYTVNVQFIHDVPYKVILGAEPITLRAAVCQDKAKLVATVTDLWGNLIADEKIIAYVEPKGAGEIVNPPGAGEVVYPKETGEVEIIASEDNTYVAMYTPPMFVPTSGKVTITFMTSNGKSGQAEVTIIEPPKASPEFSTVEVFKPPETPKFFVGTNVEVTITVRDKDKKLLGNKTVEIIAPEECILTQKPEPTRNDGVTKAKIYCEKAGMKEITAEVPKDSVVFESKASVYFEPGEPFSVEITEAPESIIGDGEATDNISIMVKDRYGNQIPSLKDLTVSASLGNITSPANYLQDGIYTATYTAAFVTFSTDATITADAIITAKASKDVKGEASINLRPAWIDSVSVEIIRSGVDVLLAPTIAKVGDIIRVTLTGEAGGKANFTIDGIVFNQSMKEESSGGKYIGSYAVVEGDNAQNAVVVVNLINNINKENRITIDTTIPPPPPTDITVERGFISKVNVNSVTITGKAEAGCDLHLKLIDEYDKEVEANVESDGRFSVQVDTTELADGTITALVWAVDSVGNSSEMSEILFNKNTEGYFEITASESEKTINSIEGGPAKYTLNVIGKKGFTYDVVLTVEGLPDGLTASLDFEKVKPDANVLLQVTVPKGYAAGEYEFKVVGEGENVKDEVDLKLTVYENPPELWLSVTPKEGRYGEVTVNLSGELRDAVDMKPIVNEIITLYLTPPSGQSKEIPVATDERGDFEFSFRPNKLDELGEWKVETVVGEWKVKASWSGNEIYESAESEEKVFNVKKGESWFDFQIENPLSRVGSEVVVQIRLQPSLKGREVKVTEKEPSGAAKFDKKETDEYGIFDYKFIPDAEGKWTITASWGGDELYEEAIGSCIVPVGMVAKAILILGDISEKDKEAKKKFNYTAEMVYVQMFLMRQMTHDDIYYLSWEHESKEVEVDDVPSKSALEPEGAITKWAMEQFKQETKEKLPLFIYLIGDGERGKFKLEQGEGEYSWLTAEELNKWVTQLEEKSNVGKVMIIIEACHSGSFIPVLSKKGRVVITSAREDQEAYVGNWSFTSFFSSEVYSRHPLNDVMRKVVEVVEVRSKLSQTPVFNANGDEQVNSPADYAALEDEYIPANVPTAGLPEVVNVEVKVEEEVGKLMVQVTSEVKRVWAEVIQLGEEEGDEVELKYDNVKNVYEGEYRFMQCGRYMVIFNAEDERGMEFVLMWKQIEVKLKEKCPWDVNGDGKVDISDLALIGKNYGSSGPEGDVNGDGTVDMFDLSLVEEHFDK